MMTGSLAAGALFDLGVRWHAGVRLAAGSGLAGAAGQYRSAVAACPSARAGGADRGRSLGEKLDRLGRRQTLQQRHGGFHQRSRVERLDEVRLEAGVERALRSSAGVGRERGGRCPATFARLQLAHPADEFIAIVLGHADVAQHRVR